VQNILKHWNKLLRIGLEENSTFKEQLRSELSNLFIFTGLSIVTAHVILNLLLVRSIPDFFLTGMWYTILIGGLLLNYCGRPKAARIYLVYAGVAAVFGIHVLFGSEMKLESMYILYLVIGAILFETRMMWITVAVIFIAYVTAVLICLNIESHFADLVNPSGPIARFIFCIIVIASLMSKLILQNNEYNRIMKNQNVILNETNEQLKSFNYIVSHDLKEPVRSIVSFSQLLEMGAKKGRSVNQVHLDHIIKSGKQLNNLLDDLITFRDSNDQNLIIESFSLNAVIEEIKLNLHDLINSKQVIINYNCPEKIMSSKLGMSIIFKNLIENGIKYNNSDRPIIGITSNINDDELIVQFQDNGIGIEAEYFKDVFALFKRLNAEQIKGSGLGLNIVHNFVNRMNGKISIVQSTIGKGTTFKLQFPLALKGN